MWPPLILIFLILSIVSINHLPLARARGQWCVVSPSATDAQMLANIDWLCGHGHVDCIPIKPGGPCFEPDNLRSHVSFVMNQYYQYNGKTEKAYYFSNTDIFVFKDPSYGDCEYDY
ncbi:unnamed protein product [Brassica rapa]|uniref:X8 domain-containing protein n=1 Tax=Brassica campestris TaxID=3711 RepID=A0A3P5Z6H3_BRACM|nr:unnamed protein product [Brassica rapa]VDC67778.1 unnamed protein product [Brassica rapa]